MTTQISERRLDLHEHQRLESIQGSIRRLIQQRWRIYYPWRAHLPAPRVTIVQKPLLVGYSVVLRFQVDFLGETAVPPILAKFPRSEEFRAVDPSQAPQQYKDRNRVEYETLVRAQEYFSFPNEGLRVVRPLDFLPEFHALLVEKALGTPLDSLARQGNVDCEKYFAGTGLWLRQYHHGLHESCSKTVLAAEFQERFHSRCQLLTNAGVSPYMVNRVQSRISKILNSLPAQRIPHSILHGDYKLRHIWVGEKGIQVLQFGNCRPGDCYSDIAALLIEVACYSLWNPRFRKDRIDAYSNAFLHGYFGEMETPPVLYLYLLDWHLKKWSRRKKRWSDNAATLALQRCFQTMKVNQIMERLHIHRWFERRAHRILNRLEWFGQSAESLESEPY